MATEGLETSFEAILIRILVRRDAEHWFAHIEGSDEVLAVGSTRAEVVNAVRPVARGAAPSELVIHRRDGSVYRCHRTRLLVGPVGPRRRATSAET